MEFHSFIIFPFQTIVISLACDVGEILILHWLYMSVMTSQSPATRLLIQRLVQTNNKENRKKLRIIRILWSETTIDRWIPLVDD